MIDLIFSICASMNAFNSTTIDCNKAVAIAKVESNLNPNAVGKSHGEIGLMQLRPEFHRCASFDPATNIRCALHYMKKLKASKGECWATYYNTGPNSGIKYPCKHKYYKKISKVLEKIDR